MLNPEAIVYVVVFKNDEGEWEKAVLTGKQAKDQFLAENQDAKPFIKRFLDVGPAGNVSYDSYLEAEESAKKSGGRVQPATPPKDFSEKSADTEFYYQDP